MKYCDCEKVNSEVLNRKWFRGGFLVGFRDTNLWYTDPADLGGGGGGGETNPG